MLLFLLLAAAASAHSAALEFLPEHLRPDPFGGVVRADGAAPADARAALAGAAAGTYPATWW